MNSIATRPVRNVPRDSLTRPKDDPLMSVRLTFFGLLLCLASGAWSAPTPQVRFPDGDLAYAQTDLSVAVRGGAVVLSRTWADGRWYLNPAWADLKLTLDAVDGSVRSIQRGGTVFAKSGNGVFVTDDRYLHPRDHGAGRLALVRPHWQLDRLRRATAASSAMAIATTCR